MRHRERSIPALTTDVGEGSAALTIQPEIDTADGIVRGRWGLLVASYCEAVFNPRVRCSPDVLEIVNVR
jgi:hypothetical protein